MRGLARAAILLSLFSAAVACRSDNSAKLLAPHHIGSGAAAPAHSQTIGDETRDVLAPIPSATILWSKAMEIPADGRLSLTRPLPRPLRYAQRVVLAAKIRRGTNRWVELPPSVQTVQGKGRRKTIEVELVLPASWRGRRAALHVRALALGDREVLEQRIPLAGVPARAQLEVAMGVLGAASGQGQTRFAVDLCNKAECATLAERKVEPGRWHSLRVALPAAREPGTELIFRATPLATEEGAYTLPVWSTPVILVPVERERRPNVILISIDTLSAGHLPSYGYPRDTTPFLRRTFESDGTIFRRMIAAASTTGPSHMTMFTALQPRVHGITDTPRVTRPAPITLAEVLRSHGYATAAVTENGPLHAAWGFSAGFDSYSENKSTDVMLPEGHVETTLHRGRQWIDLHRDRELFLFIHTFQTHYPYVPPAKYTALFASSDNPELPRSYDTALYDREIRYVDDQIRQFLEWLHAQPDLVNDTIVIVTSDHGDEFLQHGNIGHGSHLHPEVLRIPLMMRGPGIPRGLRVDEPAGHVDLMPTILELCAIPAPAVSMGRSLVPIMRGQSNPPRPIFSEAWYSTATGPGGTTYRVEQPTYSVLLGDRRLVRRLEGAERQPVYEYYVLSDDPEMRRDLFAQDPAAAADLRQFLESYETTADELRKEAAATRSALHGGARPAELPELDPAVREKLRALGYVE